MLPKFTTYTNSRQHYTPPEQFGQKRRPCEDGCDFRLSISLAVPARDSQRCMQAACLVAILKLRAKKDADIQVAGGLPSTAYHLVTDSRRVFRYSKDFGYF